MSFSVGLGRSLGPGFGLGFEWGPIAISVAVSVSICVCCRRCAVAFANLPSPVLRLFHFLDQKMTPILESNSGAYLWSGPRRAL